jgi:circadian clock protein KaiC
LAHGVIALDHVAMDYGSERRRLQVTKLRGTRFFGGYHDFRINTGGIAVFPRLRTQVPRVTGSQTNLTSGDPGLDLLLGGGLTDGTSTVVTGAAGTGKTVLTLQYVQSAVKRGDRVCMYLFDERVTTFRMRAAGLGIDMEEALRLGTLSVVQIEPTEMSPGEFANTVVRQVAENDVKLIVIDSINGFMNAMPSERLLGIQLHELLSFLANNNVSSILTLVQRGVFGAPVEDAAEVSYLADTVILLRYFEYQGKVRQALSVVKKRSGSHERTIRECRIEQGGMRVGAPLVDFQGVLTGVPHYTGPVEPLMSPDSA